jgi:hypothetical protein
MSTKPAGHFRSSPGGYFHGMVAKAKAQLNTRRAARRRSRCALDAVLHQRQSAPVRIRRSLERAEAPEHVGAGGVKEAISIEELVDKCQPTTRSFAHPDRDGDVQPDGGRRACAPQLPFVI